MLIEQSIVIGREGLRQIKIAGREVLAQQEIMGERMAVGDQVFEQTADTHPASAARTAGEGRSFLGQISKPAQNVGIASQLLGVEKVVVSGVHIAQETVETGLIVANRAGL